MTLPSRGLGRWLTLRGVTERVTGAAILISWGPPSWCRGGRHLGPEVVGAAILDLTSSRHWLYSGAYTTNRLAWKHNKQERNNINVSSCADPKWGGQGVRTPLENRKNIAFLSNTGPDPLKITKLPRQHSMLGHQRHVTETPFYLNGVSLAGWWFVCLLILLLYVPSQQLWSWRDGQFNLPYFFLGRLMKAVYQKFVHILSLVTDNSPYWMNQRKEG